MTYAYFQAEIAIPDKIGVPIEIGIYVVSAIGESINNSGVVDEEKLKDAIKVDNPDLSGRADPTVQ